MGFLNRSFILGAGLLATVASSFTGVDAACAKVTVRKEIRDMSNSERDSWMDALTKAWKTPEWTTLLTQVHDKYSPNAVSNLSPYSFKGLSGMYVQY